MSTRPVTRFASLMVTNRAARKGREITAEQATNSDDKQNTFSIVVQRTRVTVQIKVIWLKFSVFGSCKVQSKSFFGATRGTARASSTAVLEMWKDLRFLQYSKR